MERRLHRWLIVAAMTIVAMPALAASGRSGSLCVMNLPLYARDLDRDRPDGKPLHEYRYDFSVQVNDGKRVRVEERKSTRIRDLDLAAKHRVRIRDGRKVIASFLFTFEKRESDSVCLSYTPWYQTWRLDDIRDRKCGCR